MTGFSSTASIFGAPKWSDARISLPPAEPMISSWLGGLPSTWNGAARGSVAYRPSVEVSPLN